MLPVKRGYIKKKFLGILAKAASCINADYATTAGSATTAGTADNALLLNGKTVLNSTSSTDTTAPAAAAAVKAAYDLANGRVSTTHAQALHATDALRISGNTIYLYKGNGTQENISIPSSSYQAVYSATSNGYMRFTNGFMIQWGTFTTPSDTSNSVTFPTAFPTACRSVTLSHTFNQSSPSLSTTGFTYVRPATLYDGSFNINYIAMGY